VVVVGVAAAASSFLHKNNPSHTATGGHHQHRATGPQVTELNPIGAQGFDALNPGDSGDENTNQAINVINNHAVGWSSQQYFSADLGGLKAGTGLILDMGHTVRLTSVTVKFGPNPGANVQLKLGDSEARSKTNLDSMTTVAQQNDVGGGTVTFTVNSKATGQFLVIWFTRMPPSGGRFMAQVFSVSARGTVVSG
jgi:hypothetical protein